MLTRRKKTKIDHKLTSGPASMSQALGITTLNTGISLLGNTIWLEDQKIKIDKRMIISSPRVGVSYAGEYANKPWIYQIKNKLLLN